MPASIWLSVGVFGLAAGALVLLFSDSLSDRLLWLAENYRREPPLLQEEQIQDIADGVRTWGWSGIITGSVSLIFSWQRVRSKIRTAGSWLARKTTHPLPLPADRFRGKFFLSAATVLVFTALTHWSLTAYKDVNWFGGEDGASEWWSVATYLAAASLVAATAWRLRQSNHSRLAYLQLALAGFFVLGALEEISWGQRLFDWGTPVALEAVNLQGETTIHNVGNVATVIFAIFFWGSVLALAGGALRAHSHLAGRVSSADFMLPSLVMAPALLMILAWRIGDVWTAVNLPGLAMEAFDFGPQGSEVPEVLLGLCICIYTYSNLKRATALVKITVPRTRPDDPKDLSEN